MNIERRSIIQFWFVINYLYTLGNVKGIDHIFHNDNGLSINGNLLKF